MEDDTLIEPVICVLVFNCKGLSPKESISSVCILEALKFPTTLTDSDEAFKIGEPLT
jgi:hypothetical protein